MLINFVALLAGLILLVVAADKFVSGTASIARNLGVSPLLIGLTIVGLGTSAPEILVSAIASLQGNSGLAVGNALGSNIANIGLILGVTALISPLAFHSTLLKRELPVLMLISIMCFLLAFDGLSRGDSLLMLIVLVLFIGWLVGIGHREHNGMDVFEEELTEELPEMLASWKAWLFFLLGLIGLLLSSRLLVWAAINIAEAFGVSDLVIGLTIVALGTSLPELAASIASVIKKEDDLAIGNVIGSNIYNLLAVYSLPGLIRPGPLSFDVLSRDFPVMLGFTGFLFVLGFGLTRSRRIKRWQGLLLVLAYCAYQWVVYRSAVAVL